MLVTLQARGSCSGGEPQDFTILTNTPAPIQGEGLIVVLLGKHLVDGAAIDKETSKVGSIGKLSPEARYREIIGRRHPCQFLSLHVQKAAVETGKISRKPGARQNGNDLAIGSDADLATEKQFHFPSRADREQTGIFQKEGSFLRKEEIESVQVDLLFVHLHLSEIGVVGQIQRQAGCDAVLEVRSHISQPVRIAG